MASSEVQIASSSPFDWILRDRNIRSRDNANFHMKKIVRGHLQPRIDVTDGNNDENARIFDGLAAKKDRKTAEDEIDPALNATPRKSSRKCSLVQVWEARLMRCNSMNSCRSNQTFAGATRRTRSIEVNSTGNSESSDNDNARESTSSLNSMPSVEFNSIGSTESRDNDSSRQSICSMNSESGEGERIRIADIIRKLSSEIEQVVTESSKERSRHSNPSDQAEYKGLLQLVTSPKLRGRQAFQDLLMQLEKDRHKELGLLLERHPVSKFPQRGRIQSLLRLRLMQRGIGIQDQLQQPKSIQLSSSDDHRSKRSYRVKQPSCSNVMHLRELFSGSEPASPEKNEAAASVPKHTVNGNEHQDSCSISSQPQLTEDKHEPETNNITTKRDLEAAKLIKVQDVIPEESTASSSYAAAENSVSEASEVSQSEDEVSSIVVTDVTEAKECYQEESLDKQETPELTEFENECDESYEESYVEESLDKQETSESTKFANEWNESYAEESLDKQQTSESTEFSNEWDESYEEEEYEENDEQDYNSAYFNWFNDIARPRSYWEEKRKAWYEEKLSTCAENDDIRKLLERRTVSNFLESDFRDRMDQLMATHIQIRVKQGDVESDVSISDKLGPLMMYTTDQAQNVSERVQEQLLHEGEIDEEYPSQEQVSEEEEQQQEEQEQSLISRHQYAQATEMFDSSPTTTPTPSTVRSWCYTDYNEGNESSTGAPTPAQASTPTTIELEIVWELKDQISQLQREISELRKSVMSCIEMQIDCQNTLLKDKQQQPNKRTCRICHENQVDSFLYRCGHMCTCLKCAYELQHSNGNCPVCRAPILDVVRADLGS